MQKISIQVVFFGSGPVAARSLQLLQDTFTVEAIITKPSTKQLMESVSPNTPVFCVNSKSELDKLISDQQFRSILGILIDFGIIVSQYCIDSFQKGIINSHFSLLPEWRGADPITFSLLSGQEKTGISLMLLTSGMDEGPLLAQSELTIEPHDTSITLTEKLIELSDNALKQIVPLWLEDQSVAMPQEQVTIATSKTPTYSRKLTKKDGELDWHKPAEQLAREIRAFITWPKSYTTLGGKDVVVLSAHVLGGLNGPIGSIHITNKQLYIQCSEGRLVIDELKPAGKSAMKTEAFLAGYGKLLTDSQG
jgi:methionyl-tRNA formyltransferase